MTTETMMILGADENNGIGLTGGPHGLPWNTITPDLRHFQKTTKKRDSEESPPNIVLMGPKTLENAGILSGREMGLISRKLIVSPYENVKLYNSVESFMEQNLRRKKYIGGGGGVYKSFATVADGIILSRIHRVYKADCFFDISILEQFEEDISMRALLCEETDEHPKVVVHYYFRK